MEFFLILFTVCYLLLHLILLYGFSKSLSLKKNNSGNLPFVSVIVAARNEEKNIADCIKSLSKINYPADKLEIFLVNDNSSDKTFEVMLESSKSFNVFKIINSRKSSGDLKGKANAIDTAIENCSGEIIISTDADCSVNPQWVMQTVKYFNAETAMVCGFTAISGSSLFAKLQCIDWMYLLTLASSSCGLNMIMSCIGNNLSFRKSSYSKFGGYSSINFSVTEDLALMRKFSKDKNSQIKFPVDAECLVQTGMCKNLKELFSQKRRWFKGGIGINALGYVTGFELYMLNLILIFGIFFINIETYLLLISVKTFSELLLLSKTFSRFNMRSLYKLYPLFIFYFAFYGLLLPLSFLFGLKINWKGQRL